MDCEAQFGEACTDVLVWLGPTLSWPPWCVCASFLVARDPLVARDHLVRACCYHSDRGWCRARQNGWFSTDLCWQSPAWTSVVLLNIVPEACVGLRIDHESNPSNWKKHVKTLPAAGNTFLPGMIDGNTKKWTVHLWTARVRLVQPWAVSISKTLVFTSCLQ